jgi:hypothetical protein
VKLGFTGSRRGPTSAQAAAALRWLADCITGIVSIHHGNCLGWDVAFSCFVRDVCPPDGPFPREVAYPCDIPEQQDQNSWADEMRPVKPPLVRNRDIVDAADLLLACPDGPERWRSGTWSMVRYARRIGKPVVIIWPDGRVEA